MTGGAVHVAGTGTFAVEVMEFARAAGLRVAGLLEPIDPARVGTTIHGLPVGAIDGPVPVGAAAVIGVSRDRAAIGERLAAAGWGAVVVVHPTAVVSPSARLGPGTIVGPLAVVGAETRIGEHALLGRGALVGHHVQIGDGCALNPGANVAGLVVLGRGVTVGMGAAVADRRRVGDDAVVAAGAVVVRDVEAGVRVQGVPARVHDPVRAA